MSTQNNDSGLISLSGFAFQIKVLILYITALDLNRQVEFETFEDVVESKESVTEDFFDNKSEYFNTIHRDKEGSQAIQVKRTKLVHSNLRKVLFNWLLLEERENIDKYILITDAEYDNRDILFDIPVKNLYDDVMKSDSKANALISLVKNKFTSFESFKEKYELIKSKYQFISIENIDNDIFFKLENHFHKGGISEIKYNLRVKELMNTITSNVMESVFNKKSYICNKKDFMTLIERISTRITKDEYKPESFSSFSKREFIDLNDSNICKSREYIQLTHCNISQKRIEKYLLYKQYYQSYKYNLLLDNSLELIEDLESRTYDNFCDAIESLKIENKDIPLNRLNRTKEKSNSYSYNEDIKSGSCIYLTKENTDIDLLISWKDEESE
ncbi:hypothetical protein [Aliarcobacter butzleri]|uniref:hypothetical protein n=1 Tax=Aliarcobacter butzleri TaxID=28197 RepID=UPI00263CFA89|nr:hypothetical protein [Aliarcobacter butzleri]MDN5093537.1 hypothetical protein [Aliarcobacter butzleri]